MNDYSDSKSIIALKALDLFWQYGIRSVSMDDIATAAGVSKKTIYQHYTNKDELVMGVVKAALQENKEHCWKESQVAENAIHESFLAINEISELFRRMNPLVLFDLKKYHPRAYKAYSEYKSEFLYQELKNSLERGIKEGLYREDLDLETITRFRVESILIPFIPDFYTKVTVSLEEANRELFYLFMYGVASSKGYKLIDKYKKNKN